jgi:DNA-binding transcriptional regulator YiaG
MPTTRFDRLLGKLVTMPETDAETAEYLAQDALFFPSLLRIHRQRIGLTLDQAADALGVSRRTVAKWEAGKLPLALTQEGAFARLAKMPDKAS